MIDFNQALSAALEAVKKFYGDSVKDLRLEEVSMPRDTGYWDITLGFLVPEANPPKRGVLDIVGDKNLPRRYERVYKSFDIDAESGELISMTIRDL